MIEFFESKVLVIDNDPLILLMIKGFFNQTAINIITAESGQEGIALAKEEKPNLIILDVIMPGMDGFEVLELLRKDIALKNIPVISMTATSTYQKHSEDERIKYFNGQLKKPFLLENMHLELMKFLPYKTIENTDVLEIKEIIPVFNKEQIDQIPEILNTLQEKATIIWEKLVTRQSMSTTEIFADILHDIGKLYKLDIVTSYSQELKDCVKNFDIEKLKISLKKYSTIISYFKEMAKVNNV